ncbi:hypothetical protein LMH87_001988 [Akanthomyces muscarius]|uniref:AB hydrolase-1 domain-containing protein n=1 Tax=Akanthomyces muscarius TaxID=2231603 RepID=A0A9W8UIZ1_AKAMU|nr:hypothetical protein LMH87_001988 [Akanthomyces muscarius]KAJ4147474.1 hypothetical protein LMH87_001988 [Akanthomyces muscarius]
MSDTLVSPASTPDGLEPRFSLPRETPRSSKKSLVIGGVQIFVYGLEELQEQSGEVTVLYLAHNRTRTYLVTEAIAHEILHRHRSNSRDRQRPMIAVTMNMRNHGDREICPRANLTWTGGNENHGMDLLSTISGATHDFKLILDYLPCYLPQFTKLHNIMMGVSLGGHTAWRLPALLAPGQLSGIIIVVGCPSLTSLLLERLDFDASSVGLEASQLHEASYDMLEAHMTAEQRRRWPRSLANLVRQADLEIEYKFPMDVPMILCNGKYDRLVPAVHTASWLERRQRRQCGGDAAADTELFVQDNTGHSCTKKMVAKIADWIGQRW